REVGEEREQPFGDRLAALVPQPLAGAKVLEVVPVLLLDRRHGRSLVGACGGRQPSRSRPGARPVVNRLLRGFPRSSGRVPTRSLAPPTGRSAVGVPAARGRAGSARRDRYPW